MKRVLVACVIAVIAAFCGRAQSDTIVSLVTVYPGADVYELEGHSAVRVRTESGDFVANFGLFDFNTPNFIYRFVKGQTDYMVGAYPWNLFVESYADSNRKIVEQELDLTSAQKRKLLDLLREQLTPPNNVYRYNYVLDNCATRPLDLILRAAGTDTISAKDVTSAHSTFRKEMRRFHKNYPWYQFGIDLALGSLIDRDITHREMCFAPVTMHTALRESPIVKTERVVVDGPEEGAILPPTPWVLSPMAFALAVFALSVGVTIYDIRKKRMSRGFDAVLFGIYGLAGCVIAFLVFISEHYATSPNLVIWWLNPFCFIPTIFIWTKRTRMAVFVYQVINSVALIGIVIAWAFDVQSLNMAFVPLIGAELLRGLFFVKNFKMALR